MPYTLHIVRHRNQRLPPIPFDSLFTAKARFHNEINVNFTNIQQMDLEDAVGCIIYSYNGSPGRKE